MITRLLDVVWPLVAVDNLPKFEGWNELVAVSHLQPSRIGALPEAFNGCSLRNPPAASAPDRAFARLCEVPLVDWQPRFGDDGAVQVELNAYPELASVQCIRVLPRYDEHGEWISTTNVNLVMSFEPGHAWFAADEMKIFGGDSESAVEELPTWLATRMDLESAPPIKVDVFVDGDLVDDE